MKIKVGIIFGGSSKEREISFAGGRTVYDNLNKNLFEPVPLFVDSFGNFILLDWQYIYKGSIRDFYPPVEFVPPSPSGFQVYAESLGNLPDSRQSDLIASLGKKTEPSALKSLIDFAFLCLHGTSGEDGRIQGLLEYFGIPYSGSGIAPSAFGMNKAVQKKLMADAGFEIPSFRIIRRKEWMENPRRQFNLFTNDRRLRRHCVVKPANQGSSVGVSVLEAADYDQFCEAVNRAFFIRFITRRQWEAANRRGQVELLRDLVDIRNGIGTPVVCTLHGGEDGERIFHPEELLKYLTSHFSKSHSGMLVSAAEGESEVLIESFIEGREFSCIVIQGDKGVPVALPPTEILKGGKFFDYRSKYLPGLARKVTPISLSLAGIEKIRSECCHLFEHFNFNVYARIDGFISRAGKVYLNDPNTTSGMMPSSFFFHQAAEIGLNPSQFLTFIIRSSLAERISDFKNYAELPSLLRRLDEGIEKLRTGNSGRRKIAVLLGGYSSERHISVESGRNVYEKLSSSDKYEPVPVYVMGNKAGHELYTIPVNILLKDNADDIRDKINSFRIHPVVKKTIKECAGITGKYASASNLLAPRKISYSGLAKMADGAFVALHGRPGEDGVVQSSLEKTGMAYNGSGPAASAVTINKYETNEILRAKGFMVANHMIVSEQEWHKDKQQTVKNISRSFAFPFIAKPLDDGCSSAVKRINNTEELRAYSELIFRRGSAPDGKHAAALGLKQNEEFPRKDRYMVEELITASGASRFLEITGGLLTRMKPGGKVEYEIFEPSEALSGGDVLSLEEKFLAGEGQNITPARYAKDKKENLEISGRVREELKRAAQTLHIEGYARIDAFVRIYNTRKVEVVFVEVNSLPGMTPATCIFHQCALSGYKPYEFIDCILEYGFMRRKMVKGK